jgi:hypothetical protein
MYKRIKNIPENEIRMLKARAEAAENCLNFFMRCPNIRKNIVAGLQDGFEQIPDPINPFKTPNYFYIRGLANNSQLPLVPEPFGLSNFPIVGSMMAKRIWKQAREREMIAKYMELEKESKKIYQELHDEVNYIYHSDRGTLQDISFI